MKTILVKKFDNIENCINPACERQSKRVNVVVLDQFLAIGKRLIGVCCNDCYSKMDITRKFIKVTK